MRARLEDIAAEFERLSMDERLRFDVRNSSGIEVILSFRRADARPWSLWFAKQEQESKQSCTRAHLAQAAASFALDPSVLSQELCQCLILQAAYAGEFVRQVGQIVGAAELEEGLRRTRDFMDNLSKMVQGAVQANEEDPSSNAELNPEPGALTGTPGPRRPKLRIIRP